jgi:hypothetical protein
MKNRRFIHILGRFKRFLRFEISSCIKMKEPVFNPKDAVLNVVCERKTWLKAFSAFELDRHGRA